jgi:hypothetical protein
MGFIFVEKIGRNKSAAFERRSDPVSARGILSAMAMFRQLTMSFAQSGHVFRQTLCQKTAFLIGSHKIRL